MKRGSVAVAITLALLLGEAGTVSCRSPGRSSRPEKIVLVVVDTLRPDHLGALGYLRPTSPRLDRLAAEGVLVSNMIVHSSQTAPSTASLMTSLLPHQHGVQFYSGTMTFTGTPEPGAPLLGPEVVTLAELFHEAGFHTAAVVANPWLTARHGFAQGFATWVEAGCYREETNYECDGALINQTAEEILEEHRNERLLLYLHYMDVHNPYGAAADVPHRFLPQEGKHVYRDGLVPGLAEEDLLYTKALYDEGIRHVDTQVGALVDFLEREKLADETMLVVTSDHGDEFHEHGGLGHGTTLYGELVRGFAVLWSPGRLQPRRVDEPAQSVDLLPTLLAASGIGIPGRVAGVDLLSDAELTPRAGISELADRKAIFYGPWKLIHNLEDGSEELYRVEWTLGPEGKNLLNDPDAQARAAFEALHASMQELLGVAGRRHASPLPLDPATLESLRALGYLQ